MNEIKLLSTREMYTPDFPVNIWGLRVMSDDKIKTFYLGQDVKVCGRLLGMNPDDVIAHIGGSDVHDPEINVKLCDLILERMNLTIEDLIELNPWDLSV